MTFGFHTAVQIATEAIDRLHTTAESHDRVMVVEVMGRHSGWIAAYAGIAGGASVVLIPEIPFDIDKVVRPPQPAPRARAATRRSSSSPRAPSRSPARSTSASGSTTSSATCASAGSPTSSPASSSERTGFETRVVMLGHVQRGGTPTAFDRVLSTRFGVAAIDLVHEGVGADGRAPRHRDRAPPRSSSPSAGPSPRHVALPRRRRGLLRLSTAAASAQRSSALVVVRPPTWPGARSGGGGRRRRGGRRRGLRRWHRERRLRRLGVADEVVDRERVDWSSPAPSGHARRSPSTRMSTDSAPRQLAGGEHDLGDRQLQVAPERSSELVADSRRSTTPPSSSHREHFERPRGAPSQPVAPTRRRWGPGRAPRSAPAWPVVSRAAPMRSGWPVASGTTGRCARLAWRPRRATVIAHAEAPRWSSGTSRGPLSGWIAQPATHRDEHGDDQRRPATEWCDRHARSSSPSRPPPAT